MGIQLTDGASGLYRVGDVVQTFPVSFAAYYQYETAPSVKGYLVSLSCSDGGPSGENVGPSFALMHQNTATWETHFTTDGCTDALMSGSYLGYASIFPTNPTYVSKHRWLCMVGVLYAPPYPTSKGGSTKVWLKELWTESYGESDSPSAGVITSTNVNYRMSKPWDSLNFGWCNVPSNSATNGKRFLGANTRLGHVCVWDKAISDEVAHHMLRGYSCLDLPAEDRPREYYPLDLPGVYMDEFSTRSLSVQGAGVDYWGPTPEPLRVPIWRRNRGGLLRGAGIAPPAAAGQGAAGPRGLIANVGGLMVH